VKRRKFIATLGVIPSLLTLACRNTIVQPKADTIITGRITDEKEIPFENWGIGFRGESNIGGPIYLGGSGKNYETFNLETSTDKNGSFKFTFRVPDDTTGVFLDFKSITYAFDVKTKRNGIKIYSDPFKIASNHAGTLKIGETNDYQITFTKI
jgi:hypothetical protein